MADPRCYSSRYIFCCDVIAAASIALKVSSAALSSATNDAVKKFERPQRIIKNPIAFRITTEIATQTKCTLLRRARFQKWMRRNSH